MKQILPVAFLNYLLGTTLVAYGAPRLSPPLPSLDLFRSYRQDPNPGDFKSIEVCPETIKQLSELGKPVDGDPFKRHFTCRLAKYITYKYEDVVYYNVWQIAFDCKARKAIQRETYGSVFLPNGARSNKSFDLKNWQEFSSVDLLFMKRNCPARPGFVRINNIEIGVAYAVRKGSRVNVEAISDNDSEGVFAIDCSLMTYGFNRQPITPIKPRSVAHEMYKRLCLR